MGTIDHDYASALYDAAVTLSRAAFAIGHYAAAYHALASAMHTAFDQGDELRLAAVGQLADEQGAWLDEHDPAHELSASSAMARGSRSLWATLADDAFRRRQLLERRRLLGKLPPPVMSGRGGL